MPEIRLRIDGEPKGQPRPRAFVRHTATGPVARVFDSGSAESFKSQIATALRPHLPPAPICAPIALELTFLFPRPKSLLRKKDPTARLQHAKRPDVDNVFKAFADSCTHLALWADDALVQEVTIRKLYVAIGEPPGLEARIAWSDDNDATLAPARPKAERRQEAMF